MRRKLIYVADREELIIHGLIELLKALPEPVSIYGHSLASEEVLEDFAAYAPDVLFIDERLMSRQMKPLYTLLADQYPQTIIVLMITDASNQQRNLHSVDYSISKTTFDKKQLDTLWSSLSAPQQGSHDRTGEALDIRQIKKYILEHLADDLTLESVANEFGYNYSYFSTWFSRLAMKSFKQYVNELRIHQACQLLAANHATVSEAGYRVGYSSQSYFTQVFKKYTGCTPNTYRLYCQDISPSDASCILPAASRHICEKCG